MATKSKEEIKLSLLDKKMLLERRLKKKDIFYANESGSDSYKKSRSRLINEISSLEEEISSLESELKKIDN